MPRKFVIPQHPTLGLVTEQGVVGNMVRAARTKQELRIDDAAALCGVSVALLSALESQADRAIQLNKILQILDGVGLALVVTDKARARQILREYEGD